MHISQPRDWGSRLGAWGQRPERGSSHRTLRSSARSENGQPTSDSNSMPPRRRLQMTTYRISPVLRTGGGYRLWATAIELWIEGKNRIHDRARWQREIVRTSEHNFSTTPWSGTRLQP